MKRSTTDPRVADRILRLGQVRFFRAAAGNTPLHSNCRFLAMSSSQKRSRDNGSSSAPSSSSTRTAMFRQHVHALNEQFATWIASAKNERKDELWDEAARQYADYARAIRSDFEDVITQADFTPPRTSALGRRKTQDEEAAPGYELFVFGDGSSGQLGLGEDVIERPRPTRLQMPNASRVLSLAVGGMHCVAVTVTGDVFTWGVNDEGALGRDAATSNDYATASMSEFQRAEMSEKVSEMLPGRVDMAGAAATSAKAIHASAGDSHSCVVFDDGTAVAWGGFRNSSGLWAFSPTEKVAWRPRRIYVPKQGDATSRAFSCASGLDHVLLLTRAGHILSLGCGEKGRLGRLPEPETESDDPKGDVAYKTRCLVPGRVTLPTGASAISRVGCGSFTSYAICRDGRAYAWGINNYGQLAVSAAAAQKGTSAEALTRLQAANELDRCVEGPFYYPVPCDELSLRNLEVLNATGGEHHTLFTCRGASGPEMYAAGRPAYGRLGSSEVDASKDAFVGVPVRVSTPSGVRVVGAGAGTTVSGAVAEDGSMYVWGDGDSGLLCRSSSSSKEGDANTPELVDLPKSMTKAAVCSVAFGGMHGALLVR